MKQKAKCIKIYYSLHKRFYYYYYYSFLKISFFFKLIILIYRNIKRNNYEFKNNIIMYKRNHYYLKKLFISLFPCIEFLILLSISLPNIGSNQLLILPIVSWTLFVLQVLSNLLLFMLLYLFLNSFLTCSLDLPSLYYSFIQEILSSA